MEAKDQSEIINELKRLSRRVDDVSKTTDSLMEDRNILEDILTRLTALENAMHLQRATATENAKNLKADISEVSAVVEAKVDSVTENMDSHTVIVKSPKESVLQKIIHRVGGGKK